jgi:DNA modification methylase
MRPRVGTRLGASVTIHPTQKPVDIFVELIGFREHWQRICDPFGGSGTAFLAAEQLARQCVAI